ncbi:MAG: acyltransferase family protein [Bacillota bacterium]
MAQKRLFFYDNAKFILIFLVLVGHFIEFLLPEHRLARTLYIFIYTFHMPAFIFISGFFTNIKQKFNIYLYKNIKRLLVPYIIFQLFYKVFYSIIYYQPFELEINRPFWILWFLLSLFFWRLGLYLISRLNFSKRFVFIFFVTAALTLGFFNEFSRLYSASRTVVFYPFFLLGYYFKQYSSKNKVIDIAKKSSYKLGILIFVIQIIIIYYFLHNIDLEILYGALPYQFVETKILSPLFARILFLIIGFFNIFIFFSLISKNNIVISSRGARSINPYLLHGFIVIMIEKYQPFYFININLRLMILFGLSLFFSWILSGPYFEKFIIFI